MISTVASSRSKHNTPLALLLFQEAPPCANDSDSEEILPMCLHEFQNDDDSDDESYSDDIIDNSYDEATNVLIYLTDPQTISSLSSGKAYYLNEPRNSHLCRPVPKSMLAK